MRRAKRAGSGVGSVLLLALMQASCYQAPGQAPAVEGAPDIRVTDARGREVRLVRPARRIVCLIESALSGLYMLGAERQVIAVSANVYQPPVQRWYESMDSRLAHRELPVPGNWDFVNVESVVALRPDLVILWSEQSESIAALEERGIPVYGVFIRSVEDIYREMADLGRLTGREERARELVAFSRSEAAALLSRRPADGKEPPGVYFMWAQSQLATSGRLSMVQEVLTLAGARNLCAEFEQEHLLLGLESVLRLNPDLIVMWYDERRDPVDVLRDPQWRSISAVQAKAVFEFPDVFQCDLWTLKFLYAARLIEHWMRFGQSRPNALDTEMHRLFDRLYAGKLGSFEGAAQ